MNVLGVILARGGSKGILYKNIYPVANHPLIAYTITAARNSKYIDDLVVSTDDNEISNIAIKYGAKVPFIRPEELAQDNTLSVDTLKHTVQTTEQIFNKQYDYIIELPCVAPLRDSSDIDAALEKLFSGGSSVISVVSTGEKHPIRLKQIVDDRIKDISIEYPEPLRGSRRQDLKPDAYIRNGAIYAMTRATLINEHSRQGTDSRPYIMPPQRSINIDEPFDLELLEFFISKGYCNTIPRLIKPKILITAPLDFMPDLKIELESKYDISYNLEELSRADGWIVQPVPSYSIDANLLSKAKQLKFIASPSTGTNHIDIEYCKQNNIKILCLKGNPELNTIKASSEYTMTLLLAVVKKIPQAVKNVLVGHWRNVEDQLRSEELDGKTMGIIGFGRIGSNLAKYAMAMGIKVKAYDPYVQIKTAEPADLNDVLGCDIVAVCVHLNESTRGMINEKCFDQMKDGVYFINTSRGEIIDEGALLKNLENGKIRAAGLDVISGEQGDLIGHSLLNYARANDNLIITPHIAGLTYDSERKAMKIITKQMGVLLNGTTR